MSMTQDQMMEFIEQECDLGGKGLNLVFIRVDGHGGTYFHSDAYDQHTDYKMVKDGDGYDLYTRESCGDDWQFESTTDKD